MCISIYTYIYTCIHIHKYMHIRVYIFIPCGHCRHSWDFWIYTVLLRRIIISSLHIYIYIYVYTCIHIHTFWTLSTLLGLLNIFGVIPKDLNIFSGQVKCISAHNYFWSVAFCSCGTGFTRRNPSWSACFTYSLVKFACFADFARIGPAILLESIRALPRAVVWNSAVRCKECVLHRRAILTNGIWGSCNFKTTFPVLSNSTRGGVAHHTQPTSTLKFAHSTGSARRPSSHSCKSWLTRACSWRVTACWRAWTWGALAARPWSREFFESANSTVCAYCISFIKLILARLTSITLSSCGAGVSSGALAVCNLVTAFFWGWAVGTFNTRGVAEKAFERALRARFAQTSVRSAVPLVAHAVRQNDGPRPRYCLCRTVGALKRSSFRCVSASCTRQARWIARSILVAACAARHAQGSICPRKPTTATAIHQLGTASLCARVWRAWAACRISQNVLVAAPITRHALITSVWPGESGIALARGNIRAAHPRGWCIPRAYGAGLWAWEGFEWSQRALGAGCTRTCISSHAVTGPPIWSGVSCVRWERTSKGVRLILYVLVCTSIYRFVCMFVCYTVGVYVCLHVSRER